jgi:DNA-binding transcriptional ArsR family regulator
LATDWLKLRSATDYRAFLQAYLEETSLSLSDLARAAGFGRGFPGDVISGRRRLTAKSFRAFRQALKLPPQGRRLFGLLVAFEEADLFPEMDRDAIPRSIDELRRAPWRRARREVSEREVPSLGAALADPRAISVYAAAGRPGQGVSFASLRERTRLSDREIESTLRKLEGAGIVAYRDGFYEAVDLHLFVQSRGERIEPTEVFREACRIAAHRASQAMASEQELFFASAFCVDEKKMPELKAALRATALKFVDESIQPDGNRVVRLVAALHF